MNTASIKYWMKLEDVYSTVTAAEGTHESKQALENSGQPLALDWKTGIYLVVLYLVTLLT